MPESSKTATEQNHLHHHHHQHHHHQHCCHCNHQLPHQHHCHHNKQHSSCCEYNNNHNNSCDSAKRHCMRKACSIKLLLILGFVLQAAIPICIIIVVSVIKEQQMIMAHTTDIANLLRTRIRDNVDAYLATVIRDASEVWFENQYKAFDPYNLYQAQDELYSSMRFSNISAVYYTRVVNDLYVGYQRYSDSGPESVHFTYAVNGNFYDQPVEDLESGYVKPNFIPIGTNFSLATEEWHVRALKHRAPSFSDPYYVGNSMWSSDPTVWISCIYPITNSNNETIGIAGADYRLSSVNAFLHTLNLSRNSAVYIVESNTGYMLAGSHENQRVYKIADGRLLRLPLSNSTDAKIGYIGAMLELQYGTNFSNVKPQLFDLGPTTVFVDPIQFSKLNLRWTVLVMVSVTDYMAPAKSLQMVIYIVDVVVLVASVLLGLTFAILITHPLSILTSRLRRNVFFGTSANNNPRNGNGSNGGNNNNGGSNNGGGISNHRRKSHTSMLYEVSTLESNFAKMENAVNGFMKYVPREIVLNFINHPTQQKFFQPGVDPADITILFTDIEEFTSISEQLEPTVLIKILTEYLEAISSSISKFGGTLDKYIGDAVMALFNCPEKLDDYVMKACCCAIAIRDIVSQLNLSNESVGLPCLKTRIGVHTGTCLVGNIGSSYRLSYTAMGDAVNLASRIESLNKHYGSYLLISWDCYQVVKDRMVCRELDKVTVKGRTQGVKIFEIINLKDDATEQEMEFVAEYNAVMELYREKQFAAALWEVVKFMNKYPFDKAAKGLKEKLAKLIKEPPPFDWDGCTIMHEK